MGDGSNYFQPLRTLYGVMSVYWYVGPSLGNIGSQSMRCTGHTLSYAFPQLIVLRNYSVRKSKFQHGVNART